MRHYTMSNANAISKLRPQKRSDWYQLRSVGIYLLLTLLVAALILLAKERLQQEREQSWESAVAQIEDVRTQLATIGNSQRGSASLYDVQVLAKYAAHGTTQERWITVQQLPELLADAQLQSFRWKGKTCIVRWKPSDHNQVVAEIS